MTVETTVVKVGVSKSFSTLVNGFAMSLIKKNIDLKSHTVNL